MHKKWFIGILMAILLVGAVPMLVSAQQGRRFGSDDQPQNQLQNRANQQQNQPAGQQARQQNRQANQQNQKQLNQQNRQQLQDGDCCQYATVPFEGELPEDVIDAMISGLMDEYHAYNTYQAIMNQFGYVNPFANIQWSESQHIGAWHTLFDRYGVDIPAMPAVDNALTFDSLNDACQAAANAEVANFGLYDDMLTTLADYPDMVQVVTQLRNASQYNHLPAFQTCAGS